MRRADRLFQIVQFLRTRRITTAKWLSERLEVSERTIYRDIQDLSLSGVPIESEAGVGYALKKSYDLPPLMFSEDEITALVIGARIVAAQGGKMQLFSESALSKIYSVLPREQKNQLDSVSMYVPPMTTDRQQGERIDVINQCILAKKQLMIHYKKEQDITPQPRVIYPLGLFYWGGSWTMVAWCTLRDDFRHFRLDRIHVTEILSEPFSLQDHQKLSAFFQTIGVDC